MTVLKPLLRFLAWFILSVVSAVGIAACGIYIYLAPELPDPDELRRIELQTPLRVYSADGKLISEFGEKRRNPLSYTEIPPSFINALLASEDDGFFEHIGIDFKGLARAAIELIRTGEKRSGGSTITMQVAKNYYLSSEKTFTRKFTEIMLALEIEQYLSKQEILELYINKIYLGKRAYGIEAAAQVYYGKSIHELNLAQIAMIAGLPQAPSAANPINNPRRAIDRRNYVLARMLTLNMITQDEFDQAARAPVTARYHGPTSEVIAPYVAEMVRREMVAQYGDAAYTAGFRVYTTVDSTSQTAANRALQSGLLKYDRDHGWRTPKPLAPLHKLEVSDSPELQEWLNKADVSYDIDWPATLDDWNSRLLARDDMGLIAPAIVTRIMPEGAWVLQQTGERWLPFSAMLWAKPYINVNVIGAEPTSPADVLQVGMEIWIEETSDGPLLAQLPEVEGSLVSLRPEDGGIQALVGGFSPGSNQFNRAIQADRQPGSAFKPFIYSAALAHGFTPASIINDAPVVFEDAGLEATWRPENNSGKFYGPTRLREALYRSQNLVSIRILNQVGPHRAIRYMEPFGFPRHKLNADLSLALGASAVTAMELATGYAVLANGGYAVQPYLIERIEDDNGQRLFTANPARVCPDCSDTAVVAEDTPDPATPPEPAHTIAPRVMDERVHYLMISMLKDVVRLGTGQRALVLNRDDLAGKTGTTNDQKDAWFAGFSPDLVTTVWVGFDQPVTLGRWAFGSNTALPIWVDYMATALADKPARPYEQPAGIVSVRIDPVTGLLAAPGQPDAIFEYFREEDVPKELARPAQSSGNGPEQQAPAEMIPEQLF